MHVAFRGPLVHGAVAVVPTNTPAHGYISVAVEYNTSGHWVGAQPLHGSSDAASCINEAKHLLKTNYTHGRVPAGNSLIVYCLALPGSTPPVKHSGHGLNT